MATESPFSMSNPMLMMGLSLLANPRNPGQSLLAGASIANQAQRNEMYQADMAAREAERQQQQSLLAQQAQDRTLLASYAAQGEDPDYIRQQAFAAGIDVEPLLPQQKPLEFERKVDYVSQATGRPVGEVAWELARKPSAVNINTADPYPFGTGPTSSTLWKDPMNPQAGAEPVPGLEDKNLTEGQRMAGGYADRMQKAEQRMQEVTATGYDPASTLENLRGDVPLVGNYLASSEHQQFRQAQEDWVRAKLRRESGAVIADEEMQREIETYFPQPGDSPEVIEQKRQARETATQGLIRQSGQDIELTPAPQQSAPVLTNRITGETVPY